MDLSVRQIKELIKWAKKQGVKEINVGGVHVVFAENYPNYPEPDTNTDNTQVKADENEEEDVLFWSS